MPPACFRNTFFLFYSIFHSYCFGLHLLHCTNMTYISSHLLRCTFPCLCDCGVLLVLVTAGSSLGFHSQKPPICNKSDSKKGPSTIIHPCSPHSMDEWCTVGGVSAHHPSPHTIRSDLMAFVGSALPCSAMPPLRLGLLWFERGGMILYPCTYLVSSVTR